MKPSKMALVGIAVWTLIGAVCGMFGRQDMGVYCLYCTNVFLLYHFMFKEFEV